MTASYRALSSSTRSGEHFSEALDSPSSREDSEDTIDDLEDDQVLSEGHGLAGVRKRKAEVSELLDVHRYADYP